MNIQDQFRFYNRFFDRKAMFCLKFLCSKQMYFIYLLLQYQSKRRNNPYLILLTIKFSNNSGVRLVEIKDKLI